ncbi:macrophage mannose receptor 1 [Plakobranchus ocellatus]|uniref:Macrophage mannose receptor 1 n=1 Tax=Plakobranchus ocellatus TaxID=259542 RepID=A0AAV4D875_9GAST|nr:macrophage mannose receptor 1 [Plakobranchus ocellatus]
MIVLTIYAAVLIFAVPVDANPVAFKCPSHIRQGDTTFVKPFRNKCYKFHVRPDSRKQYWEAQRECEKDKGNLAMPKTAEINQFLADSLLGYDIEEEVFIGLDDMEREKDFKWKDGSRLMVPKFYENFAAGTGIFRKQEGQSRDCVTLDPVSKTWRDIECRRNILQRLVGHKEQRSFVCEHESGGNGDVDDNDDDSDIDDDHPSRNGLYPDDENYFADSDTDWSDPEDNDPSSNGVHKSGDFDDDAPSSNGLYPDDENYFADSDTDWSDPEDNDPSSNGVHKSGDFDDDAPSSNGLYPDDENYFADSDTDWSDSDIGISTPADWSDPDDNDPSSNGVYKPGDFKTDNPSSNGVHKSRGFGDGDPSSNGVYKSKGFDPNGPSSNGWYSDDDFGDSDSDSDSDFGDSTPADWSD